MRNLVSIRTVTAIRAIEGADKIEVAQVDGWQCVVKKGELHEGGTCLYFEVDSFLPATDERFAFLAGRGLQTNADGSKGYRLKTIRLRGQLSQGLAMPLDGFVELEGMPEDIAATLGVTKFERPLPTQLAGQAKGLFPAFLNKTDQERIQNMPWILEDEGYWEATQKLDGSSMSVFWNNGQFGVCSRNLELKETEGNTFWQVANRHNLREKLESLSLNICLQGELIGPGIQGNSHGMTEADFYIFDIFLIDEQTYASPSLRHRLSRMDELSDINLVPLVDYKIKLNEFQGLEHILSYAEEIDDCLNRKNPAPEGVVFKRHGGNKSFKVISNKHLLREK